MRTPPARAAFRLSPLVAALACALAPGEASAVTYVVSDTADGGTGTLRQAMLDANANCGVDASPVIFFSVPTGTAPFVFAPSSPLPTLSCPAQLYTPTIIATGQPGSVLNSDPNGFNAVTPIVLDGTGVAAYGGDGIVFDNSAYGGVLNVIGLEFAHFSRALVGNVVAKANYFHDGTYGIVSDCPACSGTQVGTLAGASDRNLFRNNSTGVLFSNQSNMFVQNNMFDGNATAVQIFTSSSVTISANLFGNGTGTAIFGQGSTATISNNRIGTFDGATASPNVGSGIDWEQGQATIQNNTIVASNTGVGLFGDAASDVSFNKIGVDSSGNLALGNFTGVTLDFCYGSQVHDNVISGNLDDGVTVTGDGSIFGAAIAGSVIMNNKIGTNAAGTAGLGNGPGGGVLLQNSNLTQVLSNVISGNAGPGVDTLDSTRLTIKDNTIGADTTGLNAIPNSDGITTTCGWGITLQDNLVAGNNGIGISLLGTDGTQPPAPPALQGFDGTLKSAKVGTVNTVLFNRVGFVFGTHANPNGSHGILVGPAVCFSGETGSNNGMFQNTVANNRGMGITLQAGTGNTLSQNSVYANVVKNVDINNNYGGPLPNDPMDPDSGPNNQQNYPGTVAVTQSGGNTTIGFTFNSTPSRTFHVEIFDNPSVPALPAAQQYRGDTFVTTDANGNAPPGSSFTLGGLTNFITLTATDTTTGDTSELSPVGTFVPVPAVSMSASSLDFGTLTIGQTSAPQTVTLTSTGSAPYHINAFDSQGTCYGGPVCVGGDFTCSFGCSTSSSYAQGQSCTISASFHPSVPGPISSTIFICDNVGVRSIALLGNGVSATSNLSMTPTTFDFGSVLVGQQSNVQQFAVTNTGAGGASLGSWVLTGDFNLVTTTCGATLAPSASCSASVSFAPSLPGLRTGSIAMNPPAAVARSGAKATTTTAPLVIASLKGTGTQVAQLDLPTSLDFGSLTLGTPLASLSVGVRNTGNAVVTFSTISIGAPFTLANNCGLNLAPGQSCTLTLGFNPATLGDFSGTLTVVSNAQGGSRTIPVTAHVVAQPVPLVRVTPGFIGFGDRMIGTQTAAQRISIRNDGGAAAPVDLTTLSNDFLIIGSSCGTSIAAQGSCFADVVFQPAGFGGRSGLFRVNSVSVGDNQVTSLAGSGCRPFVPGTSRNHQQSGGCSP